MSSYVEFGWENGESTDAHSVLYPKLLKCLDDEKDKCILDLGCGNGAVANRLIEEGRRNVYGVDASIQGISIANRKNNGHFFLMNFDEEQIPKELDRLNIDIIISLEVIEHLYSPQKYVQLIHRLLPVGGKLIISTPYNGWLKNVALSVTNNMDRHWKPLWEGGHIKFWSRKTLTSLLEKNGLKVYDFEGCGRAPYLWKSMMLCAEKV